MCLHVYQNVSDNTATQLIPTDDSHIKYVLLVPLAVCLPELQKKILNVSKQSSFSTYILKEHTVSG